MFGSLGFNAKAATILKHDCGYDWHQFSSEQKKLFKMMSKEARAHDGNEYDLAANFITTMVRSITDLEAHGSLAKKWIHSAAKLQPHMNIEHYKDVLFDTLIEINESVK